MRSVQRHSYLRVISARWRFRCVSVSDCTKDFVAAGVWLVFDYAFATAPFAVPRLPLNKLTGANLRFALRSIFRVHLIPLVASGPRSPQIAQFGRWATFLFRSLGFGVRRPRFDISGP